MAEKLRKYGLTPAGFKLPVVSEGVLEPESKEETEESEEEEEEEKGT